jgi:pyruvate dehydrogenase E1 component
MFGMQRIGDLVWAAGDLRARGFLLGGTSGRTTLAGEGLQHQDGNSHLTALTVPNLLAYDPTFAYELSVIIRDGMQRMFVNQEDIFYYLTVMNEPYVQPAMPGGVEEGILRGLYKLKPSSKKGAKARAHLFGSGAILNEALKAQEILEEKYNVSADVWSATSYKELYRDAISTERVNRLNPGKKPQTPYIGRVLGKEKGVFVAASDYVKALPASISKWIPGHFTMLGTDGYGRSDSRAALRDFFEVDARHITLATLHALVQEKQIDAKVATGAIKDMEIAPDKPDPLTT